MTQLKTAIYRAFTEAAKAAEEFQESNQQAIAEVVNLLVERFAKGHKVLFFGNGGSAADSQHLAAELVNRVRVNRKALPAIALTTDTSILTGIANDHGYEKVFARQIEALGKVDDVAFALSTSGNSPSVLQGVATARQLGLITVGLTGGDGGALAKAVDYPLVVPSSDTPRIQECHILAGHIICELVEKALAS